MTNDSPDASPADLRAWIRSQSEDFGVDVDDLLIQSKRRDAMWKGTDADHAKAKWFAKWWRKATKHRDEGKIHVRGVHYFITHSVDGDVPPPTDCSWPFYENTMTCYNYLESCAKLARILGYIPLDGIVDERHDQHTVTEYSDHTRQADTSEVTPPTGITAPIIPRSDARAEFEFDRDETTYAEYAADLLAESLVQTLRFDRPSQAPFHVEVWSEKTLPDYIKRVCEELCVNVVVEGKGDLSLTIAADLASRVEAAGKPAVIQYLSDHDPKGTEMLTNMASKVAWLKQRGDITQRVCIERLAVTPEQIQALDLPRKPISESTATGTGGKSYNTKIDEWEARKGAGATELNALENRPEAFEQLLRDGLEPFVDPGIGRKNRDARKEWQSQARACVRASIEDAGLEDRLSELGRWIHEFNSEYEKAAPMLDSLRAKQTEGFVREWVQLVSETVEDTAFPVATVPEGEGAYPEDAVYDSGREYVENLQRIQAYKNE